MRFLAVLGLAGALLAVGVLAINAGVLGDGSGAAVTVMTAAAGDSGGGTAESASSGSVIGASQGQQAGASTTAGKTYVVQDGDTFYSIARKFNATISDIQKLNPNIDPQNLTTGVKLIVP